ISGPRRPAAARTTAEREGQGGERPAGERRGAASPDASAADVRLAGQGLERLRAPVGDRRAEEQSRVVAEIRDDDRGPQLIDGGERTTGELDPDPQLPNQLGRLPRGPFRTPQRGGFGQHEHIFGFDGGKSSRDDRQRGRRRGAGAPELAAEYRADQARLAQAGGPRSGNPADLPTCDVVGPKGYGCILTGVRVSEPLRQRPRIFRQRARRQPRRDEALRHLLPHGGGVECLFHLRALPSTRTFLKTSCSPLTFSTKGCEDPDCRAPAGAEAPSSVRFSARKSFAVTVMVGDEAPPSGAATTVLPASA